MSIKLEFISYTEIINKTYRNIYKDNTVKILTDYIPEINRFDIINDNIHNTNTIDTYIKTTYNNNSIVGTNINYYFGLNDNFLQCLSFSSINTLLSNIIFTCNTTNNYYWSPVIVKYYNYNIQKYKKEHRIILDNMLTEIYNMYQNITEHLKFSLKKKYDLDISNRCIVEYFQINIKDIICNFFTMIKIFYIFSIIFSEDEQQFVLIYDKPFINTISSILDYSI